MRDPVRTDEYYHGQGFDAEEAMEIAIERIKEEIKADPSERSRLALAYIESQEDQFYSWAAKRVLDEWTPAFENGWDEKPTNREYWNFGDDRI